MNRHKVNRTLCPLCFNLTEPATNFNRKCVGDHFDLRIDCVAFTDDPADICTITLVTTHGQWDGNVGYCIARQLKFAGVKIVHSNVWEWRDPGEGWKPLRGINVAQICEAIEAAGIRVVRSRT
jgi:hypothetical protein